MKIALICLKHVERHLLFCRIQTEIQFSGALSTASSEVFKISWGHFHPLTHKGQPRLPNKDHFLKIIIKKRLTGKRLDLPVFSGLCLPFGLHSPGREASPSHKGRATQLSPDAKKTWSYREDGHNQPWNCGRVGDRLIIHSCVQEQLR